MIERLSPSDLRHLASLIEARNPEPRQLLAPADVEQLADMIAAGDKPTIGWWRSRLPARLPPPVPKRGAEPTTYVRMLVGMIEDGWPRREASEQIARIALEDEIDADTVAKIVAEALTKSGKAA